MEDNRKFATFFADAPKGKKIGAVLSWIDMYPVFWTLAQK